MGRFVYSANASLDLRIEQVPGEKDPGATGDVSEASPC
ncbi:MAG: hypothetical protein JWM23_175 [Microbacteriaceae bacterium]|jgi:hypothetical protein|nr:hypothetical protein [Microbacteriaceae bacterium]